MARSSGGVVKLDMRKATRGKRGGHRYPEGEYKIRIDKAERKQSQGGNTQIVLTCTILEPEKYKGKPLIDRLTLTEKAMYRVGWLLDACGIKWKNSVIEFPLKKVTGKTIGVLLYDDEYNKKTSSKVSEYYTEEEVDDYLSDEDEDDDDDDDLEDEADDDDEDDDEDDDDEDEDEDEEDEEDLNDLSIAELKKRARAAKVKGYKTMKKKALVAALEDEDDDEDDDEDEDDL